MKEPQIIDILQEISQEISSSNKQIVNLLNQLLSSFLLFTETHSLTLEDLQKQINLDFLTGLFNRKYLEQCLNNLIATEKKFVILMLDIDNFKMYNEQFTYEGGDNVLQELARFLVSHCRSTSDIICRLGGDEFIIILPENNVEDAAKKAEDLLDRVKSLQFDVDSQSTNINITLSIGIAGFPEHGLTVKSLLKTASKALLKAKREGRDRISLP